MEVGEVGVVGIGEEAGTVLVKGGFGARSDDEDAPEDQVEPEEGGRTAAFWDGDWATERFAVNGLSSIAETMSKSTNKSNRRFRERRTGAR